MGIIMDLLLQHEAEITRLSAIEEKYEKLRTISRDVVNVYETFDSIEEFYEPMEILETFLKDN